MIYTFYSFKGGVGRSMAMANIAEIYRQRGLRVLAIDFDLEAPGLERYLCSSESKVSAEEVLRHRGLLDLIWSYREVRELSEEPPLTSRDDLTMDQRLSRLPIEPLDRFVVELTSGGPGSIKLMPAGQRDGAAFSEYARRVLSFSWDEFHWRMDGGLFFEWLRRQTQAREVADVVLVDSRTGVTEMGGVCAYLLADAVISFVGANQQNLDGVLRIAKSLHEPNSKLTEDRAGRELKQIFVPARVERDNPRLEQFREEFEKKFGDMYPQGLQWEECPYSDLLLQYMPAYAHGEVVVVRRAKETLAGVLVKPLERLAKAMARLAPADSRLFQAYGESIAYLQKSADEKMSGWTREDQDGARRLLCRLVRVGDPAAGVKDVRMRIRTDRIEERERAVGERLIGIGLVASANGDLELTHEGLIEGWPLLRGWIEQDRDFLRWRQTMAAELERWESTQDANDLLSGTSLSTAVEWRGRKSEDLNQREMEFINSSESHAVELIKRHTAIEREKRVSRLWGSVAVAVMILILGFGILKGISESLWIRVLSTVGLATPICVQQWEEGFDFGPNHKWSGAPRWKNAEAWIPQPGRGSDPRAGSLLVEGKAVGMPANLGRAAFYDFMANFEVRMVRGKAEWMLRAQNDGRDGYLFVLEQQPRELRLNSFLVREGAQAWLGPEGGVPLQVMCCDQGEWLSVRSEAAGFTFSHSILRMDRLELGRMNFDPVTDKAKRYRFGSFGLPGSGMAVDNLLIVPSPLAEVK